MSRKSKNRAPRWPLSGIAEGPDRKGRFFLPLGEGTSRLLFYGAAPGEEVTVRRGRRTRRGGELGDLLRVDEPSPQRRLPRCSHFGVCGGCTLQHLSETEALELKASPVYQALQARCPEVEIHPPVPSPRPFFYRTKVELTFLAGLGHDLQLGFHRRGRFDRLVELQRCWLTPLPPRLLTSLKSWAGSKGLKGWNPRTQRGDLRYLVFRQSSTNGQSLAVLVVDSGLPLEEADADELIAMFRQAGVDGAFLVRQSAVSGAVVPDSQLHLFGLTFLEERLGGLTFKLDWRSFFQINPPAYERMLESMALWRHTPAGSRVLDLFCGIGSIGMVLAQPDDQLLGVELVEEAVRDARLNAQLNGRDARFEVCSSEDWIDHLDCELLILDPPRSGCHPKLLKALVEGEAAQELFYVSCNPERLLHELDDLLQRYRLLRAQAFDFFPQTHHLELLLQFQKK